MSKTTLQTVTSVSRSALRIVGPIVAMYLVYLGVLYALQDDMVFPGTHIDPPTWSGSDAVELWSEPIDDGKVEALFAPAPGASASAPAPLLVFFHGNGGLIDASLVDVEAYHRLGFSLLVPEYRGYGRSSGSPGESVIVEDALRFVERAARRPDVDSSRIVYQGQSLGGAVAVAVAAKREPEALILESTFTNLRRFASAYYAPGWLLKNTFDSEDALAGLDVPVLLMHADEDPVVPYDMGQELAEAAQDVQFESFDGPWHVLPPPNESERYWSLIDEFTRRSVRH